MMLTSLIREMQTPLEWIIHCVIQIIGTRGTYLIPQQSANMHVWGAENKNL